MLGFASTTLPIHWTHTGRVGGLIRAIVQPPDEADGGELEVHLPGQPALRLPATRQPDGSLHLNIHTHLLPDGPGDIEVILNGGKRAWRHRQAFEIHNPGTLAAQVREALTTAGVPVAFVGDCDAAMYERAQSHVTAWVDAPDAEARVDAMLAEGRIGTTEAEQLRRFLRDGFVILDEPLPEALIEQANADIDRAVAEGYQGYRYGDSTRLEQMHQQFPGIRGIWLHPPVHRMLSLIFGVPSQPCQSLVYVFGSQQDAHQDTVHLTPFPAGAMCGVWVALEDVRAGAGELVVYPGSHRLPRVYLKDVGCGKVRDGDWREFGEKVVGRWAQLIREHGLEPVPYLARRGQILIWHENLMHAGSVRRDPTLSRRSVVTHNFAQGAIVYYDSSGNVGYVYDGV
ncbi:MAG: phytanoyl-CoA dioxygenase family protein [Rehaibacterium terrae]|uniref:phytanoyl-CoA dioxygenase family protein n=1 Tax=Rehaibacterium terrae TaxID=1341696 RepID=UPI00391C1F2D